MAVVLSDTGSSSALSSPGDGDDDGSAAPPTPASIAAVPRDAYLSLPRAVLACPPVPAWVDPGRHAVVRAHAAAVAAATAAAAHAAAVVACSPNSHGADVENNGGVVGGGGGGGGTGGSEENVDGDDDALVELRDDEFQKYYVVRHGRLFHSHGMTRSSYRFPVDGPEMNRLDAVHELLKRVFGAFGDAPVASVLNDTGGGHGGGGATTVGQWRPRTKKVIDLCTGTGLWPMEMAVAFPDVEFFGIDAVPIATRYPHDNVQFEIADVCAPLRFAAGSVDVVHARMTGLTVDEYALMLTEAARVLRPGGLFVAAEWGLYPALHHDLVAAGAHPAQHLPASARLYAAVNALVNATNPRAPPLALALDPLLRMTGKFESPTHRAYMLPLGAAPAPAPTPPFSSAFAPSAGSGTAATARTLARIADAARELTLDYARCCAAAFPELADAAAAMRAEVVRDANASAGAGGGGGGAVNVWHCVWARKV